MIHHLPREILSKIFSYVPIEDIRTLRSSLLVNREWCRCVVPILWRKPFTLKPQLTCSLLKRRTWNIIYVYSLYLDDETKKKLLIDPRNFRDYTKSPLFDYPSLLREVDFIKVYQFISKWKENALLTKEDRCAYDQNQNGESDNNSDQMGSGWDEGKDEFSTYNQIISYPDYFEPSSDQDLSDLSDYDDGLSDEDYGTYEEDENSEFGEEGERNSLQFTLELFKVFFNHSPRFDILCFDISNLSRVQPHVVAEYLNQVPNLSGADKSLQPLSELRYAGNQYSVATMEKLVHICTNLKSIEILEWNNSDTTNQINQIASLIKNQKSLKKLNYRGNYENLASVVIALKSQIDSLEELELINGYFNYVNTVEAIAGLSNLRTLKIKNCNLTTTTMYPLIKANFPKLTTFHYTDNQYDWDDLINDEDPPPVNELKCLLKNVGKQLQEISLDIHEFFYVGIIKILASHCPNLVTFSANIQIDQLLDEFIILLAASKKLEKIVISANSWNRLLNTDHFMRQVGQAIPASVRYLDLTRWTFGPKALEAFLEESKANLEHFAWHCPGASGSESVEVIREYAKKHKLQCKELQCKEPSISVSGNACKMRVEFNNN
ncbi:3687_t:CDS:2 [Ambispora leptoticha]|uniref:3687_t:CDS:1 n=1 Tax=Ambispora leptoticha TaxID=144679 RepID=A0A9N8V6P6_9GLOM|nr:3687_t:CDS:2 [Ambispora leptoticha]